MCFCCSDPWVGQAITTAKIGGSVMGCGNSGECNIYLYNGGHWGSYGELLGYVDAFLRKLDRNGSGFKLIGGQFRIGRKDTPSHVFVKPTLVLPPGGRQLAPLLVDLNTGRLIGQDGSGLVSHDGGTLTAGKAAVVSNDGGSLRSRAGVISQDGGGLVSHDGGTIHQSTGGGMISLGRGTLVLN